MAPLNKANVDVHLTSHVGEATTQQVDQEHLAMVPFVKFLFTHAVLPRHEALTDKREICALNTGFLRHEKLKLNHVSLTVLIESIDLLDDRNVGLNHALITVERPADLAQRSFLSLTFIVVADTLGFHCQVKLSGHFEHVLRVENEKLHFAPHRLTRHLARLNQLDCLLFAL